MNHQLKSGMDFQKEAENKNVKVKFKTDQDIPGDVCIFSSFSFSGKVDEYIYYYLDQLQKSGFSIIFISTSTLSTGCVQMLSKFTVLILERENVCPDFGSWKAGIAFLDLNKGNNGVLLANDSVFGPFFNLNNIISSMKKRYDVWGMTDNYQINYHLQSYFLYFNNAAVNNDIWSSFWGNIDTALPKQEVILQYEVKLSELFYKANFRTGAYVSVDVIGKEIPHLKKDFNITLGFWKILIEQFEFPFLKREVLIRMDINKLYWDRGLYVNMGKWKRVITQNSVYPVILIEQFMKNYFMTIKTANNDVVLRNRKLLFLSHNADIGGAQRVLINFMQWIRKETDIQLEIIICNNGNNNKLLSEFSECGIVTNFFTLSESEKTNLKERLLDEQIGLIFSNTIVNVGVQRFFSFLDVPQILFVHELNYVLKLNLSSGEDISWIRNNVAHFIACAGVVKQNLVKYLYVDEDKVDVVHEFINADEVKQTINRRKFVKADFGIPSDGFVVGMCGTFEWRKSADLLPVIAACLCQPENNIHIVWLGAEAGSELYESIQFDLNQAGLTDRVHLIPKTTDNRAYFNLFDVFLMASREDPFPLVNLESGLAGVPVICFLNSGGSEEYVKLKTGHAVPYLNISALAEKVFEYYNDRQLLKTERDVIPAIVEKNFLTAVQAPKIFEIIKQYYDSEEMMITEDPSVTFMTHIYYEDSWPEIKNKLKNFDNGRNYFLFSISDACLVKESIVEDIKSSFTKAFYLITSNIGKDIGGKMALIDLYLLMDIKSSYIVFLHDKKSPQTLVGESWRNNLFKIIDHGNHKLILNLFKNPKIGIIGAKEHIMNEYDNATGVFRQNNQLAKSLLKQYGITIDNYEYLSGTMYWLRASIIEKFFATNNPILMRENLESGNVLDNNGDTLAHTWERMFCWIANKEGFALKGI